MGSIGCLQRRVQDWGDLPYLEHGWFAALEYMIHGSAGRGEEGLVSVGALPKVGATRDVTALQTTWKDWMVRHGGLDDGPGMACPEPGSAPAEKRLMTHQKSVIAYVGAQVKDWASANRGWGPGKPIIPAGRRGLLVAHSVGAGKTGTMLGCALAARQQWPEATVIFAAAPDVTAGNANNFKNDYDLFEADLTPAEERPRPERTTLSLDGGRGAVWGPTGYRLDHRVSPLFRTQRGRDTVVLLTLDNLIRKLVDRSSATGPRRLFPPTKRRWPDGPVVLIVDEAHNLTTSAGTGPIVENYRSLRQFLMDDEASRNVFVVLCTATPGETAREAAELCQMVAPRSEAAKRAIDGVIRETSDAHIEALGTAVRGCVDFFSALGNAELYPIVRFVDRRGAALAQPYFTSQYAALQHVNSVCSTSRGKAPGAVERFLAEPLVVRAVREYGLSGASPYDRALAVLQRASEGIRRSERLEANHALVGLARYHTAILKARKNTKDPAKMFVKKSKGKAEKEIAEFMDANAAVLRRQLVEATRRGTDADAPPPLRDLATMAPKLVTLLLRMMDGGRDGVLPCKQVVVIPVPSSQNTVFRQHYIVEVALQKLCGLQLYKGGKDHRRTYINAARGPRGVKDAAVRRRIVQKWLDKKTGIFNAPDNHRGERMPVLFLPDDRYVVQYSLLGIQRIHIVDWGKAGAVAQAIGRAQRPLAACVLPRDERVTTVHTYAECGGPAAPTDPVDQVIAHLEDILRHIERGPRHSTGKKQLRHVLQHEGALVRNWDILLSAGLRTDDPMVDRDIAEVAKFVGLIVADRNAPVPPSPLRADPDRVTRILTQLLRWEQARSAQRPAAEAQPDPSLDTALAVVQAREFKPVYDILRALIGASVSCQLYMTTHRLYGQLPGIPVEEGLLQTTACVSPA